MVTTAGRKIGWAFANVLICGFFTVCLFVATTLGITQVYFSEDNLHETISNSEFLTVADDNEMARMVLENISAGIIAEYNITQDRVALFITREASRTFIAEQLVKYVNAFRQGYVNYFISVDDITHFIRENEAAIRRDIGYPFYDGDYANIRNYLIDGNVMEQYTIFTILTNANINVDLIQGIFSTVSLVAAWLSSAALGGCIVAANLKYLKTMLSDAGAALCINGVIFLILGLLADSVVASFVSEYISREAVSDLLSNATTNSLYFGVGYLVAGIAAFIGKAFVAAKQV
jgi:hypothetical protein